MSNPSSRSMTMGILFLALVRSGCEALHDANISNSQPAALRSADTILLQVHTGMVWDVVLDTVRARWPQQTELFSMQALVIEKEGGGFICSGDTVYLRSGAGKYIDVFGRQVMARWSDRGTMQALVITGGNASGIGSIITSGQTVFFQADEGKYIEVEQDVLLVLKAVPSPSAAMQIQTATPAETSPQLLGLPKTSLVNQANSTSDTVVNPGDVIFLWGHEGFSIDVGDQNIQARWSLRGNWQAITIEKAGSGPISSGDSVFLRTCFGSYIGVDGLSATLTPGRTAANAFTIIKEAAGLVFSGDAVFFQVMLTGKLLDVENQQVQARWTDLGLFQAFVIEREDPGASKVGDKVVFLAPSTGKRLGLHGSDILARWDYMTPARALFLANDENLGPWMHAFTIEGGDGRALYSGDSVALRAYTGNLVDAGQDGSQLQARWPKPGGWQTFILQRKLGAGPVRPGDAVFLQAYNGNRVAVSGPEVHALASNKDEEGLLIIEAFNGSEQGPSGQYRRTAVKVMIITLFSIALIFEFASNVPMHKA